MAAAAAWPVTLTVDGAVELAERNNISIQRERISLDALKRTKNFSWNGASPSLSVSGALSFPNPDTPQADQYNMQGSLSGSVNFALSPSIYSSIKTARLNYENGLITYDEAARSVELLARKMFYGLLYEKENIALQKRNLDTARERWEQNSVKYRAGRVSEVDMLTSQVSYEQLKPKLESAVISFDADIASFKQLLGIDLDEEVELQGTLDDALALGDISVEADVDEIPSVVQAANGVKIAEAALLARRMSAYGPTISAGWSIQRSINDSSDGWSKGGQAQVGVSIPLDGFLPWSTQGQNVSSAKDNVKTKSLELQDTKISMRVKITNCVNQARQGQSQVDSLKANIALAQKTYDMTLDSYNHGSADFLALQSASDALLNARVSLAAQEYTLMSAVLDLESALGAPFGTIGKQAE